MQLGNSKKQKRKNKKKEKTLLWNRIFTLYLEILIIDKTRVYDDDIWKKPMFVRPGADWKCDGFFP